MTAVRVIERVIQEIPGATMHLLGPGSGTDLDAQVKSYVASRGLEDRVKLLGLVPEETLWNEYVRANVMLMTSLEETAPVAIGEAFAVGIPVVGMGGVESGSDARDLLKAGASLVAVGTASFRDPLAADRIRAELAAGGVRR